MVSILRRDVPHSDYSLFWGFFGQFFRWVIELVTDARDRVVRRGLPYLYQPFISILGKTLKKLWKYLIL